MEIAEEEEEERERKRKSLIEKDARPQTADSATRVTLDPALATSPDVSEISGRIDPPDSVDAPRPVSPANSFDDAAWRMSSQSACQDLYSYSSYPYSKPRVKLGPRPSLETGGRPQTSGGPSATGIDRPISSVPAGLRLVSKGSRKCTRPVSGKAQTGEHDDRGAISEAPEITFLAASLAIPEHQVPDPDKLQRPHTSSGAHGAVDASESSFPPTSAEMSPAPSASQRSRAKSNLVTPEKARLLKAMRLRQKKQQEMIAAASRDAIPEVPAALDGADLPLEPAAVEAVPEHDKRLSAPQADSGIEVDLAPDRVSIGTRSDSHPASPVVASSEIDDSTHASSLSESTEETVHADEQRPSDGDEAKTGGESGLYTRPELESENVTDLHGETSPGEPSTLEPRAPNRVEDSPQPGQARISEAEAKKMQVQLEGDGRENTRTGEETKDGGRGEGHNGVPSPSLSLSEHCQDVSSVRVVHISGQTAHGVASNASVMMGQSAVKTGILLSKFSTRGSNTSSTAEVNVALPVIVEPAVETEPLEIEIAGPVVPEKDERPERIGLGDDTDVASLDADNTESKRGVVIQPIGINLDLAEQYKRQSMVSLIDDDDLLEELRSATLQEAKPITVSKSPITPMSPSAAGTPTILKRRTTSAGLRELAGNGDMAAPATLRRIERISSTPIRSPLFAPEDAPTSSARAVSSAAAPLHKITQEQNWPELRPKSSKIGMGIAARLKALEKLSGSQGADAIDRTKLSQPTTPPLHGSSRDSSPDTVSGRTLLSRNRAGSISTRLSVFEGGSAPRGRPEVIEVKARLWPKVPESKADPGDLDPPDRKQSQSVVDLQKPSTSATAGVAVVPAENEPSSTALEEKPSLLKRRVSKDRRSRSRARLVVETNPKHPEGENDEVDHAEVNRRERRRSFMTLAVKDFIKDSRDSLRGKLSPSADSLHNLALSPTPTLNKGLASPLATPASSRSPTWPPSVHHNSTNLRLTRRVSMSMSSRRSSAEQKSPALLSVASPSGSSGLPLVPSDLSGDSDGESHTGGQSRSASASASPAGHNSGSSRAQRFIRRLSNSLNTSRKNYMPAISPTVAEGDVVEEDVAEEEAALAARHGPVNGACGGPIVAYMGDVNVQFPDSLLWKRRTLCLDSLGFLVLSTNQSSTAMSITLDGTASRSVGVKRYHMSEFRMPYTPEIEVEELPFSVVLNLVGGGELQVACDDKAGQLNVLHSKSIIFGLWTLLEGSVEFG